MVQCFPREQSLVLRKHYTAHELSTLTILCGCSCGRKRGWVGYWASSTQEQNIFLAKKPKITGFYIFQMQQERSCGWLCWNPSVAKLAKCVAQRKYPVRNKNVPTCVIFNQTVLYYSCGSMVYEQRHGQEEKHYFVCVVRL